MSVLDVLADPTRRHIVAMLGGGDLAAGDIAARFSVTAPAISQHLKVLRDSGLVRVRGEAQKRIYALDREGWNAVRDWVSEIEAALSARENGAPAIDEKAQSHAWADILGRLGA